MAHPPSPSIGAGLAVFPPARHHMRDAGRAIVPQLMYNSSPPADHSAAKRAKLVGTHEIPPE